MGLTADTHFIASTGIGGRTDCRTACVAIDFQNDGIIPENRHQNDGIIPENRHQNDGKSPESLHVQKKICIFAR